MASKALKFALGAIQAFFWATDSDLGTHEITIKKIKIALIGFINLIFNSGSYTSYMDYMFQKNRRGT